MPVTQINKFAYSYGAFRTTQGNTFRTIPDWTRRRLILMRPAASLASTLALFAAIGLAAALALAGLNELTESKIEAERRDHALRAVSTMLSGMRYDNDLLATAQRIDVAGLENATAYTARRDGQAVALVMDVVTPQGYSGDIRLLVAIHAEGQVLGVRVLEHRETPGLGDRIESGKSDWLRQFEGKSLGDPPAEDWAPDRRGGAFDTVTSATITSSAVTDAVKRVLQAFESNRASLLAATRNEPQADIHD
jgi:electron transport complex protein RnfG